MVIIKVANPLIRHLISLNHTLLLNCEILFQLFFSEFAQGIGKAPPEIDNASCRKLLRRSVATIIAHAGHDSKCFFL